MIGRDVWEGLASSRPRLEPVVAQIPIVFVIAVRVSFSSPQIVRKKDKSVRSKNGDIKKD